MTGIFLHDPTCMAALLDPSLFTYKTGALRVETKGICVGHTLLDMGLKKYFFNTLFVLVSLDFSKHAFDNSIIDEIPVLMIQ